MTNDISSTRRRAIALLLAAFIGGGAIGAVADRAYVAKRQDSSRRERRGGGTPGVDQIPLPLERLDLTPKETDSLHAIARRWRPQAGDALNAFRDRVSTMENSMFADMLCVLTPDQLARYKADMATFAIGDSVIAIRLKRVNDGTCDR